MSGSKRVRGFAEWNPQIGSLILVDDVRGVLHEYSDYLPLTLRQIFYRLVGTGKMGKTENDYARLCECMNRARRANYIPMSSIRDDGITVRDGHDFNDEDQLRGYLLDLAGSARMDLQRTQPVRVEAWCEAAGMLPQLHRVASGYGVTVISSGGFDSLTSKYDMAQRYAKNDSTIVLHIGDHDPSGVHVFSSLAEDISAMVRDISSSRIGFERVAVLPDHITEYGLPTTPPKRTDKRSFVGETVQAEALPPKILAELVDAAIQKHIDQDLMDEQRRYQNEVRSNVSGSLGKKISF